jgi:hypothetical protein
MPLIAESASGARMQVHSVSWLHVACHAAARREKATAISVLDVVLASRVGHLQHRIDSAHVVSCRQRWSK